MFFLVGFVIATIGAGATPASALLAPPAMAVAARAGIPLFLMAIMAGNGALAGTLSPFAPTGIVAHGVMARIGLGGVEWQTFAYNALAHAAVGIGGFLLFGGWKLFVRRTGAVQAAEPDAGVMESRHWVTCWASSRSSSRLPHSASMSAWPRSSLPQHSCCFAPSTNSRPFNTCRGVSSSWSPV